MVQTVAAEGVIEDVDQPMPSKHWQRHRKPNVHLLRESPFATDRFLEDKKREIEFNRNPQLHKPTKADKDKSEIMMNALKVPRPVAIKANVLNKIVREASGVYSYVIVPPPKDKTQNTKEIDADPQTNPTMRPYAREAKMKPVLCSFGHRPRSASRTFHPATMKLRLRHGEIVQNVDAKKSSVGLPVATLSKVLKAPSINRTHELPPDDSDSVSEQEVMMAQREREKLRNDLFFSDSQQQFVFGSGNNHNNSSNINHNASGNDNQSEATWISSIEAGTKKPRKSGKSIKLQPLKRSQSQYHNEEKPAWDDAFHRKSLKPADVYRLKANIIVDTVPDSLVERLTRFIPKSVDDTTKQPFCREKYEIDKMLLQQGPGVDAASLTIKTSTAAAGQELYYDPWDVELADIKRHRKQQEQQRQRKLQAQQFQRSLSSLEPVDYYPTTLLAQQIKQGQYHPNEESILFNSNSTLTMSRNKTPRKLSRAPTSSQSTEKVNRGISNARGVSVSASHIDHEFEKGGAYLEGNSDVLDELFLTDNNHTSDNSNTCNKQSPQQQHQQDQQNQQELESIHKFSQHANNSTTLRSTYYNDDLFEGSNMEAHLKAALKAAKRGDTTALYNFNMNYPDVYNRTAMQSSDDLFKNFP